jgi:LPS-assembly lipoprotein
MKTINQNTCLSFASRALLVAAFLVLSSCGFQLRGSGNTAAAQDINEVLLISSDRYTPLHREAVTQLERNGISVVTGNTAETLQQERPTIYLIREKIITRVISLQKHLSSGQIEAEYTLVYSLNGGKTEKLVTMRQYNNNKQNIGARENELDFLRVEMRKELLQKAITQLLHRNESE